MIFDGIADRGIPEFEGKTPLQEARTPNLDYIASLGTNGLYHSGLLGVAMPSELAQFRMLGYRTDEFPGRGALEALGYGVSLTGDDVALLASVFSVRAENGTLFLEKEKPEIDEDSLGLLHDEIRSFESDGMRLELVPTEGRRSVIVLRGDASAEITDSNPIYAGRPLMEVLPIEGAKEPERASRTARVLNSYLIWVHERLDSHRVNNKRRKARILPVNAVGTQRAGRTRDLPSFEERWGLKALAVSSGAVYHGLSAALGLKVHKVDDSEDPCGDLAERLKIAREADGYDFVYVHTKAPDEAAHKKSPELKKSVIESLDRSLIYARKEIVSDDSMLFVVTADHSTPSAGRMIHSGEAVPLAMVGKHCRRDDVRKFDEISCSKGALGAVRGTELMYLILSLMDKGKLFGLMDAPVDQPYFPGRYKPLRIGNGR